MDKVLELENIDISFGKLRVMKGLSFSINEGEIVGLIGHNGIGKTSVMNAIMGFVKFSGEINLYSNTLFSLIDSPKLIDSLDGLSNIKYFLNDDFDMDMYTKYSCLLFPNGRLKEKVRTYSLGMKQKLKLLIVIASTANLYILDEPFIGIDSEGIRIINEAFLEKKKKGEAFLVSSHDIYEVEKICDRVIVLAAGKKKELSMNSFLQTNSYYFSFRNDKDLMHAKEMISNSQIVGKKLKISVNKEDNISKYIKLVDDLSLEEVSLQKNDLKSFYDDIVRG